MLHTHLISAGSDFWLDAADWFLSVSKKAEPQAANAALLRPDYSELQVIVPTFEHARYLQLALVNRLGQNFIPPQINTLFGLLDLQGPDPSQRPVSTAQHRLCQLYQALRQHDFLKTIFALENQLELLALARTLLILFDELSAALLPRWVEQEDSIDQLWQQALHELPETARACLSDEARMVWSLWQAQLDKQDPAWRRLQDLLRLARPGLSLFWISPTAANPFEQAFLNNWQQQAEVYVCSLSWQANTLPALFAQAWPQLLDDTGPALTAGTTPSQTMAKTSLLVAHTLEQEASQAAQLIVNYLREGKQHIAVIAQDRQVARRLRALLERAHIHVADETGWKLSTSGAAACLQSWFNLLLTNADSRHLLDFLKSAFVPLLTTNSPAQSCDDQPLADQDSLLFISKDEVIYCIELQARLHLPQQDWRELIAAIPKRSEEAQLARHWLTALELQARYFTGQASLAEWAGRTLQSLQKLAVYSAFQRDQAGAQILQLLQNYLEVAELAEGSYSLSEWRALLLAELEESTFIQASPDQRVQMLPLNGARLRHYDAVIVLGADTSHLPSQSPELLFFANGVRRELGLVTREQRQQQQLRDLAELILNNPEVVFSWQSQINGEPNPLSPWLQQLNLQLELNAQPVLPWYGLTLPEIICTPKLQTPPKVSAAELSPEKLSASAFHSLLACPYQFFVRYMLKLDPLEDWADDPEKREYGQWLHLILRQFHEHALQQNLLTDEALQQSLHAISESFFNTVLTKTPVALGFKLRWDKLQADYLSWWQNHRQQGWQFSAAEQAFSKDFVVSDAYQVKLHGRLDRLDTNQQQQLLVLDYKTRKAALLKKRLQQCEDQQLAFYALAADQAVEQAQYLSLEAEKDGLQVVELEDLPAQVEALSYALRQQLSQIREGAELPAQGSTESCNYCAARGLCRKGMWY